MRKYRFKRVFLTVLGMLLAMFCIAECLLLFSRGQEVGGEFFIYFMLGLLSINFILFVNSRFFNQFLK